MFEYLPIQNSDQFYSFVGKYGATVATELGAGISIPTAASASSSNFIQFGYSLAKLSVDIDDTFNASKRFCLKVSYDNLTNPAQSLIDAFVNKLACFAVKANDTNTRFDLQVASSLFNAKTNMVEVYFTLPEEFVKYVPEHIGETFDFHIYYNVIESLGRKISGNTTSWIYTFHRDVIFPTQPDRVEFETSSVIAYSAPKGLLFSCQFYDYADSPAVS